MRRSTRPEIGEGCQRPETPPKHVANEQKPVASAGVVAVACVQEERRSNTGSPGGDAHASIGNPRGPAWAGRVAERLGVPRKPGNAGGGKGPQVERNVRKGTGTMETGASLQAPVTVRKTPAGVACASEGSPERPRGAGAGALAEAVQAAAPVAELEAPGEVGEGCALPGWTTVAGPRSGTPASAAGAASRGRRQDLEREPSAENPHAGFEERGEETWSRWRPRYRPQGESRRQPLLPPSSTSAPLLDSTESHDTI